MISTDRLKQLNSPLPSQRAIAAEWLRHNASFGDQATILSALAGESVAAVRTTLAAALSMVSTRQENENLGNKVVDPPRDDERLLPILDSLAGLIRHETDPAVGWLRRAASSEVVNFATSQTNRRIEILRERLLGLETLAAAHRIPRWSRLNLTELIDDCMPSGLEADRLDATEMVSVSEIDTDKGLLSLIITNALKNADEATRELASKRVTVMIRVGVTEHDFWLTVSNRFAGESFDLDHISHTGASNKINHKGLGLTAMRLAAERLRYDLSIQARNGTAHFSLRGSRYHV